MSLFSILTRPLFVLVAGIIVAAGIIANYGYGEEEPWPPTQGVGVSDPDSCYSSCVRSTNSVFTFSQNGETASMQNYCMDCSPYGSPNAPGCWHDTTLDTAKDLCCEMICGADDGKAECYRSQGAVDVDRAMIATMCQPTCGGADALGLSCSDGTCPQSGYEAPVCGQLANGCGCCVEDVHLVGSPNSCCNGYSSNTPDSCASTADCGGNSVCAFSTTGLSNGAVVDFSSYQSENNCSPNDPNCGVCIQVINPSPRRGCSGIRQEINLDGESLCVLGSVLCAQGDDNTETGDTDGEDTAGTSGGSGGGSNAGTSGGSGGGESAGTSGGSGGGESAGTSGGSGGGESAGTSGGSGGGDSAGTSGGSGGIPQGIEPEGCSTHCNSNDPECYNIAECEYEKYEGSR